MAFQVVGLAKIGLVSPEGLLFNGFDSRRKQSVQPQRLAFEQGKSCALVQGRSFQQRAAPEMCGEPGWHLGVIDYGHGNLHERSEEHTSELQSLTNLVCR